MIKSSRKAILLAGGNGTRFAPISKVVNKHLFPIYIYKVIYDENDPNILYASGDHHGSFETVEIYKCNICNQFFEDRSQLNRHVKTKQHLKKHEQSQTNILNIRWNPVKISEFQKIV